MRATLGKLITALPHESGFRAVAPSEFSEYWSASLSGHRGS